MMKIGVVIDAWKLDIFNRHLSKAGYKYDKCNATASGNKLLLKVYTHSVVDMEKVVRAAQDECAQVKQQRKLDNPVPKGYH